MGRYEFRFHNGTVWTADVSVNGVRYVDPYGLEATPPPAEAAGGPGSGLGLAAMILGIVAITIAWLPFIVALGAICALLAVVFGAVSLARSRSGDRARGFATAGVVTGLVGAALCVVGVLFTVATVNAIDRFVNPPANEASITSCETDGSLTTVRGELTNLSDDEADFGVVVAISRPGTDNVHRRARAAVDNVAPGDTVEFELFRRIALPEVDCTLVDVTGPLPFGLELDLD